MPILASAGLAPLHSASRPGYSGERQSKQATGARSPGSAGCVSAAASTDAGSAHERVMCVATVTGPDAFAASARPEDPQTAAAVARGKDGDRDAVRFLYERYAGGVRQLAYRML